MVGVITDVVLDAQGDGPAEQVRPGERDDAVAEDGPLVEVDVVGTLLDALQDRAAVDPPLVRPGGSFDVQYWACWAAVALLLVLLTYVWITS